MENNIITNKELYFHYAKELGISNEDAIVLLKLALAGFGKEIKDLPNTEYYQPLFNLMSEHNLTLLEGEMDEIIDCVLKMVESSKTSLYCDCEVGKCEGGQISRCAFRNVLNK